MEKTRLIFVLSGTALLIYLLNKEEEKKEPEPIPLYAKIGIGAIPVITAAFIGGKHYLRFIKQGHHPIRIGASNRENVFITPFQQYMEAHNQATLRAFYDA